MLFSFGNYASSNVLKTASQLKDVIEKKTLISDFTKENEKFVNDKKTQQRREDAALPPWVGFNEEEKMKEQILALSQVRILLYNHVFRGSRFRIKPFKN